jgi:hypothetical protein
MSNTAGATIKLRRDTAANWAAANPVLALAEPGLEIDTNSIKYGNGVTAWNSLPYASVPLNAVSESIVPAQNEAVDLGADGSRFGELYLSGNSIYLGNVVLSASGSTFLVNGEPLPDLSQAMINRGADANNWNNITTMGVYAVNRTSWSGTTGTPLDSQVFVGTLEVMAASTDSDTAVTQIFYPGITNSDPTLQFTRSNWNGAWTAWYRMLNQEQIVSGGLF